MMNQTDAFLDETMPRLRLADTALHDGDAVPRMAMWSRHDPVTLFGGVMGGSGWTEIEPIFERLGASFTDCRSFDVEVIAARASGDLAYTVAYERTTASVHGRPPAAYMLRVTTVFRREDGEWKVVHRHADPSASPTARDVLQQLASGPEDPLLKPAGGVSPTTQDGR
jgi:ketosteroid isomerase-like protein